MAQYISKRSQLQLVVRPTDRTMDEQRRVTILPGKRVGFFDHYFETTDPEVIAFLDRHPQKGKDFDMIQGDDVASAHKAIKRLKNNESIRLVTGASTASSVTQARIVPPAPVEVVRPETSVAISPEVLKVIDDRINAALETIIGLLKSDTKKEEKIMEGKPTKSFKCPYCDEVFSSGFKVGSHKKECPKKP